MTPKSGADQVHFKSHQSVGLRLERWIADPGKSGSGAVQH